VGDVGGGAEQDDAGARGDEALDLLGELGGDCEREGLEQRGGERGRDEALGGALVELERQRGHDERVGVVVEAELGVVGREVAAGPEGGAQQIGHCAVVLVAVESMQRDAAWVPERRDRCRRAGRDLRRRRRAGDRAVARLEGAQTGGQEQSARCGHGRGPRRVGALHATTGVGDGRQTRRVPGATGRGAR
jgi:hypothetical protein